VKKLTAYFCLNWKTVKEISHSPRTKAQAANMALLREALPVKKLTAYFCLNWKTVKEIDKQSLRAKLGGRTCPTSSCDGMAVSFC